MGLDGVDLSVWMRLQFEWFLFLINGGLIVDECTRLIGDRWDGLCWLQELWDWLVLGGQLDVIGEWWLWILPGVCLRL